MHWKYIKKTRTKNGKWRYWYDYGYKTRYDKNTRRVHTTKMYDKRSTVENQSPTLSVSSDSRYINSFTRSRYDNLSNIDSLIAKGEYFIYKNILPLLNKDTESITQYLNRTSISTSILISNETCGTCKIRDIVKDTMTTVKNMLKF